MNRIIKYMCQSRMVLVARKRITMISKLSRKNRKKNVTQAEKSRLFTRRAAFRGEKSGIVHGFVVS